MNPASGNTSGNSGCDRTELLLEYALQALSPGAAIELEAHVSVCSECRRNLEFLQPVIDSFAFWPTDVLRPSASLWGRLAQRLTLETGQDPIPPAPERWVDPEWEEVAPGISCRLLATDIGTARVSMLVRLAPGVAYPPHVHAGVEELHLLDGELVIDNRTLHPGDYNRGLPGESDALVWSETGCTCVLVTSARDILL
jgi:anti-sigma factor ChrR (cupin superfamily)